MNPSRRSVRGSCFERNHNNRTRLRYTSSCKFVRALCKFMLTILVTRNLTCPQFLRSVLVCAGTWTVRIEAQKQVHQCKSFNNHRIANRNSTNNEQSNENHCDQDGWSRSHTLTRVMLAEQIITTYRVQSYTYLLPQKMEWISIHVICKSNKQPGKKRRELRISVSKWYWTSVGHVFEIEWNDQKARTIRIMNALKNRNLIFSPGNPIGGIAEQILDREQSNMKGIDGLFYSTHSINFHDSLEGTSATYFFKVSVHCH